MSCLVLSSSLLSCHDKLCDIYSKQCEVHVHVNVTLCLSYLLHAMHCLLHFHVFIHLHLAPHLGTLDAPRDGCNVGAKPEDLVWWIYLEDGRTKQVLGPEMSP